MWQPSHSRPACLHSQRARGFTNLLLTLEFLLLLFKHMLIACSRNPFTLVSTSLNTHIRKQMPKGQRRVKKELCCSPMNTISKGDFDLQGKPPGRPLLFKEKIKYHINHSLGREQQTCGCKPVWDGHLTQWSSPAPG